MTGSSTILAPVFIAPAVVLVQCVGSHRDVKAGCYEGHECTSFLTGGADREANTTDEGP